MGDSAQRSTPVLSQPRVHHRFSNPAQSTCVTHAQHLPCSHCVVPRPRPPFVKPVTLRIPNPLPFAPSQPYAEHLARDGCQCRGLIVVDHVTVDRTVFGIARKLGAGEVENFLSSHLRNAHCIDCHVQTTEDMAGNAWKRCRHLVCAVRALPAYCAYLGAVILARGTQ